MSALAVVALVVGLLLVIGVVTAAVLVPLVRRWRRGADQFLTDLRAEAAASGEMFVTDPETANYRGGTGGHSAVKGNGTLVLTDRRLVFRKLSGGVEEVPRSSITGTRTEKTFLGSRVGGQTCLVIETDEPAEIGFFVIDLPRWQQLLGGSAAS
ncbi:hypothetical protein ACE2AJ_04065 [Aquihabitans daechungensis]|uniref:hypothetical protein n=1 Tax=Aquihabitans daechungensis TaxID=1052257 RepID=UPI003B9F8DF4